MSHLVAFVGVVVGCWSALSIVLSLLLGRVLREDVDQVFPAHDRFAEQIRSGAGIT